MIFLEYLFAAELSTKLVYNSVLSKIMIISQKLS